MNFCNKLLQFLGIGEKGDKGDEGEKGDKGDEGEKGDKGDKLIEVPINLSPIQKLQSHPLISPISHIPLH
uniref:Uncharacterized protein n=1 Tax=Tolypothrix bouteillei VB521301 TaxID=1479485 RepID=A0A0C1N7Q2_9CYAN